VSGFVQEWLQAANGNRLSKTHISKYSINSPLNEVFRCQKIRPHGVGMADAFLQGGPWLDRK